MTTPSRLLWTAAIAAVLSSGPALAANWTDTLNSAASALGNSGNSAGGESAKNSAPSISSLTGLLNGGDKALSAGSMTNAAGILEYCVKNNVLSANGVSSIKDNVMKKLGISSPASANSQDYQQGLGGLLNTAKGGQLNLKSLGSTPLGEKVKTKACDLILKQSKNFIA
ncbi:DUF2501 domain-containing protein [Martelella alba]|uniref:DUF2501 domain-containing protein n=1 Tax=Martelella alba TaxID=2590451 RepID=A0ABY2SG62_9HYPH|nr:DUF2501 domain-containing protein [Martelella alba]TKI02978.1 DUF2501 domain-containing protein [Martelella alba]